MEFELIISESFQKDMDEVIAYISLNLYNPVAASRLLKTLRPPLRIFNVIRICILIRILKQLLPEDTEVLQLEIMKSFIKLIRRPERYIFTGFYMGV